MFMIDFPLTLIYSTPAAAAGQDVPRAAALRDVLALNLPELALHFPLLALPLPPLAPAPSLLALLKSSLALRPLLLLCRCMPIQARTRLSRYRLESRQKMAKPP
ncbi:hypothetical protein N7486_001442 [Penicillium sp. IBT 16267x]|nr:hypothetical protein N7486_001442 [Penicillium sp. IBT 16267x]